MASSRDYQSETDSLYGCATNWSKYTLADSSRGAVNRLTAVASFAIAASLVENLLAELRVRDNMRSRRRRPSEI